METSNDLALKIKLTPSQVSILPSIVEKINRDPDMLLNRLAIIDDCLIVSCHDTFDLLEAFKSENLIELARMKRQLKNEVDRILESADLSDHQRKNYLTSAKSLGMF